MFEEPLDWSERDTYMYIKHGVFTHWADEAYEDPARVIIHPDYASISGDSTRIIGFSRSADAILTVIVVDDNGHLYGANGWKSNAKDQQFYHGKGGDDDEQNL